MSSKIKTLVELEQEKKKVKMQMEVSKRAFIHSFGTTQTQAKNFLMKKVAIPAGAVGLVTMGANELLSNTISAPKRFVSNNGTIFKKIIPLALPFIQSILAEPEVLKILPPFVRNIITPKVRVKKIRSMEKV